MWETFINMFKIPDLKKRLLFTMALLGVYRLGAHIPTPGIDTKALVEFFQSAASNTIFGIIDMFSGGSFANMTVFALGIMPYISASIILQLLTVVVPYLEQLSKEGEQGRKKITQYTRYGTVVLSVIQSIGIAYGLEKLQGGAFVTHPGWPFRLMTMITLTAGTAFIMWLGEQITDRGIGNGISLIIFAGIVVGLPSALIGTYFKIASKDMQLYELAVIFGLILIVVALVVIMQQGQRKIPVQYAKRMVGRRMYGGQSTFIPMRVNTAGVIPVIFAQSIIMFPLTIGQFVDQQAAGWARYVRLFIDMMAPGEPLYNIVYVVAIIFFTYFYTAIIFNPVDLADNMKKYGGFVPGIRPGPKTADFINRVLTRITLAGAIFLALISILPMFLVSWFGVPFYFGGTALLIVVGVGLDTVQQLEAHLLMRHYDGFMKKSKRKR